MRGHGEGRRVAGGGKGISELIAIYYSENSCSWYIAVMKMGVFRFKKTAPAAWRQRKNGCGDVGAEVKRKWLFNVLETAASRVIKKADSASPTVS